MPDIGRWGVVDPLAEKYYDITPFSYVANNPINAIDPDGRDIRPLIYREIDNDNIPIPELYKSYPSTIQAMKNIGKTTYGKNLIASFLKKGDMQYGVKGNGKYSNHNLVIQQFDIKPGTIHAAYTMSQGKVWSGQIYMREFKGKLEFVVKLNLATKNVASLTETLTHELALHGHRIDETIRLYEKNGLKAAQDFWDKESAGRGKADHDALENDNYDHKGVEIYHEMKNEIINNQPFILCKFKRQKFFASIFKKGLHQIYNRLKMILNS